ncbi:MAG: peptide deformylase [Corynebacteriales bacterium]|nr:peptide deformylase [Mycobacteriales bacterium]
MTTAQPQGKVLPIRIAGDPVLHEPCADVTEFDAELEAFIETMFASMYAAEGVGLAANQIGVAKRIFVYDCPDATEQNQIGHVINPVLRELPATERILDDNAEACLSVPGQHAFVARPDTATVDGVDKNGNPISVTGTGLLARCLQHETDHLNGYLYIDRIAKKERQAILKELGTTY